MANPVQPVPSLPFPKTGTVAEQQAIGKVLQTELIDHARRLNLSLPTDGTEPMEAPLTLGIYATADLPDPTLYEGAIVYDTTTNQFLFSNGTAWRAIADESPPTPPPDPDEELTNYGITASVGSNILTVSVVNNLGATPDSTDPVWLDFRDPTIATGTKTWVSVTGSLSMTTNATGATLGSANSIPFRLWVVAFNDAGTVRLALWQSITGGGTPTALAALDDTSVASATGISGSATSAGTFYCANGTSVTSKAYKILGYLDYNSGLSTAGSYASVPTKIQIFGPDVKLPGDWIQGKTITTNSNTSTTSTTYITSALTLTFTITSEVNLVRAHSTMSCAMGGAAEFGFTRLQRGTVAFGGETAVGPTAVTGYFNGAHGWAPRSTNSTTYAVFVKTNAGATVNFNNSTGTLDVWEIMA